jgi:C4-dicarboxylate transporter DctM subunit
LSDPLVGLIGFLILFVFLFLKVPVGFALALVGFGGFAVLRSVDGALGMLAVIPFRVTTNYHLAVIPLFVLMGAIVANSAIARDLFATAYKWVGRLPGGLASATVLASGGFAAVTGSALAGTTAIGKIVAPEFRRYNYDPRLSAGCVAAGGTLGSLIPPSMAFIIYGILTEQSVGRLFMAGVFPGILEVVFYLVVIYVLCRLNPSMGPAGPGTSFKVKIASLGGVLPVLALFLLVMGGIYGGIFTPTEAGGIGAAGAIVISLAMRRLSFGSFIDSLLETVHISGMTLLIVIGAYIFGSFMAISQLPFFLANWIAGLSLPPLAVLALIIVVYLLLGCAFEIMSVLVLTIPIIFPIIKLLGIDPIWYGVIMVRMLEVGAITPPIGIGCYVTAGIMDIPAVNVFRGVFPFILADLCNIALLVAVPTISLWLPSIMMG